MATMRQIGFFLVMTVVALLGNGTAGATSFAVLLSGSSGDVYLDGCDSVDIGDVTVDAVTDPVASPGGYLRKRPGKVKYANVSFRMNRQYGGTKEFQDWFTKVRAGQTEGRKVAVVYQDKANPDIASRYTLMDCFPVRYSEESAVLADGSVTLLDVYELSVDGVQLERGRGGGASVGKPIIRVSVTGADGVTKVDTSFGSWSGGEPVLIMDFLFRGASYHAPSPGNKTSTDLVLGDGTPGSALFYAWINELAAGSPSTRTLSLNEIVNGRASARTYTYNECWPCRFVFPKFSSTDAAGAHAVESITLVFEEWKLTTK